MGTGRVQGDQLENVSLGWSLPTIFYGVVSEFHHVLQVKVYHHPKGTTIFLDGGNDFQDFEVRFAIFLGPVLKMMMFRSSKAGGWSGSQVQCMKVL